MQPTGRVAARHHRRPAVCMTQAGDVDTGEVALADTSVFIAVEQHRPVSGSPPAHIAVSVITVGELRLGVLAAETGR